MSRKVQIEFDLFKAEVRNLVHNIHYINSQFLTSTTKLEDIMSVVDIFTLTHFGGRPDEKTLDNSGNEKGAKEKKHKDSNK